MFTLAIMFMVGVLNLLALVWVIYDVLSYQKKMPDVEKLIWVIVAIFLGLIGAVLYFLLVKSKGKYEGKREDFT